MSISYTIYTMSISYTIYTMITNYDHLGG
jgi:hypothetical protein